MKIRTQLSLALSGMLTVSFLAAVLAIAWVLKRMVLNQLYQQQQAHVQMLSSVSQQAMVLGDELFLLNYVRLLRDTPGVAYAYVVDRNEKVLVHTRPEFVYQPLNKWKAAEPGATIEWDGPVRLAGGEAGIARIGFSKEHTQATLYRAWREILYPIAVIAGLGVFFSLLLGIVLAVYMSRSIRQLVGASQEISRGNLQVEVPVNSSGELGELARQFNYMIQQLQKLDELKAEFIANVSHDLRSPMGAIVAYSNYLLSGEVGKLEPQQSKSIEVIRNQCHRLINMVNNILDMGKIQSGKMVFLRETFSLEKIAEDVAKLFEITAKHQEVALTAVAAPNLPLALGDSEKVHQVLTNLVTNALKFTGRKGSVTIGVRLSPSEDMLQVLVRDTGSGIPPEELPRMFERFHQVNIEEQRAKKIHGSGLGLAICRGIVEGLGGRIWVESKLEQGTVFYFTLPKVKPAAVHRPVAVAVPESLKPQ